MCDYSPLLQNILVKNYNIFMFCNKGEYSHMIKLPTVINNTHTNDT